MLKGMLAMAMVWWWWGGWGYESLFLVWVRVSLEARLWCAKHVSQDPKAAAQ